MKVTLATLFLILTSTMAFAVDNPDAKQSSAKDNDIVSINKEMDKCLNQDSGTSNYGMQDCMGTATDASDKILNQVYQAKIAGLNKQKDDDSKEIKKRLVASERAWIAFKDAQCSYEGADALGGSEENIEIMNCLLDATQKRIVELRNAP